MKDIAIEHGARALAEHPLRAAVLGELHARPFTALETPRRLLHYAFMIDAAAAQAERTALSAFCAANGVEAPSPTAKHHRCRIGSATLRWESHAEFSTYTWELPAPGAQPFTPKASAIPNVMASVPQPGPLLVAVDVHLVNESAAVTPELLFDRSSLARARVLEGAAQVATDFQPDEAGFVRMLVADRGLKPDRAGALVQRVLEIETYRTLALLGLPEAQRLAPRVQQIEKRLAEVTDAMRRSEGLVANSQLLDELTAAAAELEADTAGSAFRFGASRAYYELVRLRLAALGEQGVSGFPTWSQFLDRRMAPAMRTCASVEQRQGTLADKLARAAQLLRTRVEVDLERQNQDLLKSMNERTRLQLRLQWTVEGLSVAAISYYVVGLLHYLFKGIHDAGLDARVGAQIDPELGAAIAVPFVVLLVAMVVRSVRGRHFERTGKQSEKT